MASSFVGFDLLSFPLKFLRYYDEYTLSHTHGREVTRRIVVWEVINQTSYFSWVLLEEA
jgi:hypothetical protein